MFEAILGIAIVGDDGKPWYGSHLSSRLEDSGGESPTKFPL